MSREFEVANVSMPYSGGDRGVEPAGVERGDMAMRGEYAGDDETAERADRSRLGGRPRAAADELLSGEAVAEEEPPSGGLDL